MLSSVALGLKSSQRRKKVLSKMTCEDKLLQEDKKPLKAVVLGCRFDVFADIFASERPLKVILKMLFDLLDLKAKNSQGSRIVSD